MSCLEFELYWINTRCGWRNEKKFFWKKKSGVLFFPYGFYAFFLFLEQFKACRTCSVVSFSHLPCYFKCSYSQDQSWLYWVSSLMLYLHGTRVGNQECCRIRGCWAIQENHEEAHA